MLEVRKAILIADQLLNGNNHKFEIELIDDTLNQNQQDIYNEYKNQLNEAETLDERISGRIRRIKVRKEIKTMKAKIKQAMIDTALAQANKRKAPSLHTWFNKNATKQAKEQFKKFKPQNNQDLLALMMNNSPDKQIIGSNTIYLKHNRKHILVFVNRQQNQYVVVDVDFKADVDSDLKKIKEVMANAGYDTQGFDDSVLFIKHSNFFGIDVTMEIPKQNLEEELKDLGNREEVMENLVTYSEFPQLTDNFLMLCKDLMEVRRDILVADQALNGNNHKFEIELITDTLDQNQQEIYDEYTSELNEAEYLEERIGVICDYAGINEDEFERLEDMEEFVNERHKELINLANKGLKFQDFTKHYEDLFVLETLWEDIEDDARNILNSEEYEEEYGN